MPFKIRPLGNALTEYCVIGFIGAFIVIAPLSMLGQSITHLLNNSNDHTGTSPTLVLITSSSTTTTSKIQKSYLITSQGSKIELDNLPSILSTSDLTATVQTAGANGTTTLLSNTLNILADKLKANGSIDQNTYDDIVALATQGHKLAQIETAIDTAAKAAGNGGGSGFDKTSVLMSGHPYSGPEVVAQISSNSSDILAFKQLQNKVLDSTVLTDPNAKNLITQLSENILNIANASAISGNWIDQDGVDVNSHQSYISDFPDLISDYANKTKGDANGICSAQNQSTSCMR